jgi:hypothetical protein
LKSIATANGAVYIMVVNGSATSPYTGNRAEPINLKVERKEDFLRRLQSNHQLDIRASCLDVLYSDTTPSSRPSTFWGNFDFTTITWNGTYFYSDHESLNPGQDDYYVDGTVDPVNKTVTCTYTYHYDYNGSTMDTVYTITSLPIHSGEGEDAPYLYYPRVIGDAWGTDCPTYITSVTSGGHTVQISPPLTYDWSLSNFNWSGGPPSGDYIITRFWNGV